MFRCSLYGLSGAQTGDTAVQVDSYRGVLFARCLVRVERFSNARVPCPLHSLDTNLPFPTLTVCSPRNVGLLDTFIFQLIRTRLTNQKEGNVSLVGDMFVPKRSPVRSLA